MFGGYLFLSGPMIIGRKNLALPVNLWTPYSIEDKCLFVLTYLQHILTGSFIVWSTIAIDTLFIGVLLILSSQIDILKYRLGKFNKCYSSKSERSVIIHCVQYCNRIYG